MKIILIFVSLICGPHALALDIDWKLYLRTPVGTNSEGGKQIFLKNPKSQGNEFRLGNETAYGEAYFTGHLLKGGDKDPFFDANLTFAYNPAMNSQYGDTTPETDYTQVIQAFVKGGRFDDMPFSAWAGKRFYRDADLHMNDFYYFADMSGVGGGVEDISVGNGTLAVALLQQSDASVRNATNGVPAKQAIDWRWRDLKLSEADSLTLWFAAAYSAPGTGLSLNTTTNTYTVVTDYEAGHGFAQGVRWRRSLGEKSSNNFAVMYGTGVMENLTMGNSMVYARTGTNVNDRKRWRIVDNPVFEIGERWSLSLGFVFEDVDNGMGGANNHSRYYSVGVRPVYYFSDHYHLVFEAGHSLVKDDSETDAGGREAGERTLTRLTLAPELALARGYLSRPVIRAYVSHTFWNGANADAANTSSLISKLNQQNISALDDRREETQFGVQAEVWF